jgi:hypothetical protein
MIEQDRLNDEQFRGYGTYSPVTVAPSESIGTVALAVMALILLVALLRSQRRIQELQEQKSREVEL